MSVIEPGFSVPDRPQGLTPVPDRTDVSQVDILDKLSAQLEVPKGVSLEDSQALEVFEGLEEVFTEFEDKVTAIQSALMDESITSSLSEPRSAPNFFLAEDWEEQFRAELKRIGETVSDADKLVMIGSILEKAVEVAGVLPQDLSFEDIHKLLRPLQAIYDPLLELGKHLKGAAPVIRAFGEVAKGVKNIVVLRAVHQQELYLVKVEEKLGALRKTRAQLLESGDVINAGLVEDEITRYHAELVKGRRQIEAARHKAALEGYNTLNDFPGKFQESLEELVPYLPNGPIMVQQVAEKLGPAGKGMAAGVGLVKIASAWVAVRISKKLLDASRERRDELLALAPGGNQKTLPPALFQELKEVEADIKRLERDIMGRRFGGVADAVDVAKYVEGMLSPLAKGAWKEKLEQALGFLNGRDIGTIGAIITHGVEVKHIKAQIAMLEDRLHVLPEGHVDREGIAFELQDLQLQLHASRATVVTNGTEVLDMLGEKTQRLLNGGVIDTDSEWIKQIRQATDLVNPQDVARVLGAVSHGFRIHFLRLNLRLYEERLAELEKRPDGSPREIQDRKEKITNARYEMHRAVIQEVKAVTTAVLSVAERVLPHVPAEISKIIGKPTDLIKVEDIAKAATFVISWLELRPLASELQDKKDRINQLEERRKAAYKDAGAAPQGLDEEIKKLRTELKEVENRVLERRLIMAKDGMATLSAIWNRVVPVVTGVGGKVLHAFGQVLAGAGAVIDLIKDGRDLYKDSMQVHKLRHQMARNLAEVEDVGAKWEHMMQALDGYEKKRDYASARMDAEFGLHPSELEAYFVLRERLGTLEDELGNTDSLIAKNNLEYADTARDIDRIHKRMEITFSRHPEAKPIFLELQEARALAGGDEVRKARITSLEHLLATRFAKAEYAQLKTLEERRETLTAELVRLRESGKQLDELRGQVEDFHQTHEGIRNRQEEFDAQAIQALKYRGLYNRQWSRMDSLGMVQGITGNIRAKVIKRELLLRVPKIAEKIVAVLKSVLAIAAVILTICGLTAIAGIMTGPAGIALTATAILIAVLFVLVFEREKIPQFVESAFLALKKIRETVRAKLTDYKIRNVDKSVQSYGQRISNINRRVQSLKDWEARLDGRSEYWLRNVRGRIARHEAEKERVQQILRKGVAVHLDERKQTILERQQSLQERVDSLAHKYSIIKFLNKHGLKEKDLVEGLVKPMEDMMVQGRYGFVNMAKNVFAGFYGPEIAKSPDPVRAMVIALFGEGADAWYDDYRRRNPRTVSAAPAA